MNDNEKIINYINNRIPFSYSKYGDGEYLCATGYKGENANGCKYNEILKTGLIESFKYIVDETSNGFVGFWGDGLNCPVSDFFQSFVEQPVKWVSYGLLITNTSMDANYNNSKINIYRAIKKSKLKKIYVCNSLLNKAEILLDIDVMINIPLNNWYDTHFDEVFNKIKNNINKGEQYIIMSSSGMASKILIAELSKLYPNNIYLDIGSALDKICTKTETRGIYPSYKKSMEYFKDLIPDNWDDPKYNFIYEEADKKLGHFRRNTQNDRKTKEDFK